MTTSILGTRVVRKEDPALLTGKAAYTDDVPLPGGRRVTFVRSSMPHARLTNVDVAAARTAPGVRAVVTADDLDHGPFPPPPVFPHLDTRFTRWWLAKDTVRFVGEPIVAIVADDAYAGADAAELVVVEYDPLPVVVDPEQAADGEMLLFPEAGTNVCAVLDLPPVDGLFDGADVVVTQKLVNRRVAPAPMEGRSIAASWDGSRLTLHASTQGIAATRDAVANVFGLDASAVRVVAADVGGGFGSKSGASSEELVVAWLALRLGGVVRWTETRSENLLAMTHGRGQVQTMTLGATADGRLVGMHLDVLQDAGGYPDVGAGLPAMTMVMTPGVYAVPKVAYTSRAVVTNTTPMGAYRGAGRPEAAYALERTMDVLAARLGLDPVELRRRNLLPASAFPVTTPVGMTYDCGDYAGALDRALAAAGYDDLRAEQSRRRTSGSVRLLGIGVSTYVEITGAMPGPEPARVEVRADGSAVVHTGSTPHGQGHVTSWAMVASDRLGIPVERIDVVHGDTDVVPDGGLVGGSRSAQTCGVVVGQAADAVVARARSLASDLLEAAVDDVVLDDDGRFTVVGSPTVGVSWPDVVAAADGPLAAEEAFAPSGPTFPFGAHVAVVEVDVETGQVELLRFIGVDDAGRVLNPLLFEGQVHGGIAQGAAQALLEEVAYDAEGNPLTSTFADYAAVSAAELPSFELVEMETPTPVNPLGAKGIGESGTVGATPAVVNAVVDALAHLGVTHIDMPTTPERVWRAIAAGR